MAEFNFSRVGTATALTAILLTPALATPAATKGNSASKAAIKQTVPSSPVFSLNQLYQFYLASRPEAEDSGEAAEPVLSSKAFGKSVKLQIEALKKAGRSSPDFQTFIDNEASNASKAISDFRREDRTGINEAHIRLVACISLGAGLRASEKPDGEWQDDFPYGSLDRGSWSAHNIIVDQSFIEKMDARGLAQYMIAYLQSDAMTEVPEPLLAAWKTKVREEAKAPRAAKLLETMIGSLPPVPDNQTSILEAIKTLKRTGLLEKSLHPEEIYSDDPFALAIAKSNVTIVEALAPYYESTSWIALPGRLNPETKALPYEIALDAFERNASRSNHRNPSLGVMETMARIGLTPNLAYADPGYNMAGKAIAELNDKTPGLEDLFRFFARHGVDLHDTAPDPQQGIISASAYALKQGKPQMAAILKKLEAEFPPKLDSDIRTSSAPALRNNAAFAPRQQGSIPFALAL